MREGKLGDVILLDNNALPTSQIFRRYVGANKITAFIPNAIVMTAVPATDRLIMLGLMINEFCSPYSLTYENFTTTF